MKKLLFLFAALFLIGLSHAFAQSALGSAQRNASSVVTDTTSQVSEAGSSVPAQNALQRNSQQSVAPGTNPAATSDAGQKAAARKEEPGTVEPH